MPISRMIVTRTARFASDPLKRCHLVLLISSFSDVTAVPMVLVAELDIYYNVSNVPFEDMGLSASYADPLFRKTEEDKGTSTRWIMVWGGEEV